MDARYFDAHSHAHFPAYGGESDAVIKRAKEADVEMILVGTERATSKSAIEFAERTEGVWAAVGLHPTHTTAQEYVDVQELGEEEKSRGGREAEVFDDAYYRELAMHPKVVAIGECGLDYFRLDPETARIQQDVLLEHVKLAKEVGKPLTIHCRNAFPDLIDLFEKNRELLLEKPGTIHFFTGTQEDATRLLDLGFYLQFGGVITFAKQYEEVVRSTPLNRIITETDAPYVAPVPYRGRQNEPAYVVEVTKKIAELKEIELSEVRRVVRENVKEVFGV